MKMAMIVNDKETTLNRNEQDNHPIQQQLFIKMRQLQVTHSVCVTNCFIITVRPS